LEIRFGEGSEVLQKTSLISGASSGLLTRWGPLGGGSPEVVIHGTNGLVVPPGDSKALAAAVSELFADPSMRERFGRNNRKKALQELSLERMARESVEVYTKLLERRDS
jgi:glycosyltransferase involved in cell wall biosynthesis